MTETYICNGEKCLHNKKMLKHLEEVKNYDGSYPDPIDNSPCDHCIISK